MVLSLDLRTRLYNQCVMAGLRYDGPGRVALRSEQRNAPAVAAALSAAFRPDLALALAAAAPEAVGAAAVAEIRTRHRRLFEDGLLDLAPALAALERAPLGTLADAGSAPSDLRSRAVGLREAQARAELGLDVADDLATWSADLRDACAGSHDVELLLEVARTGDRRAALELAEVLREARAEGGAGLLTPAGARRPGDEVVDPILTWQICEVLWDVDRTLAEAVVDGFCDAVRTSTSDGMLAPHAFTPEGVPLAPTEDAGTAAVALLLAELAPGQEPLDGTPAVRGTAVDEELFLAGAQRLDPATELPSGGTAAELLGEHMRPPLPPGVTYAAGIQYGEAEGVPLRLHLMTPAPSPDPAPVVVFVHGGGWQSGNPAKFLRQATDWAGAGWITATIGYRLLPQTVWPGPLLDVLAALRYVSEHAARLNADVSRVALVGNSAGGHLALMAAARDELLSTGVQISAVVAISPVTDLQWPLLMPEGVRLMDRLVAGDKGLLADASPVNFVQPGLPPVLTFGGDADALTTAAMLTDYHRRLDEAGVPNELHILPGRFHAFEFAPRDSRFWSERAFTWLGERFTESRVVS